MWTDAPPAPASPSKLRTVADGVRTSLTLFTVLPLPSSYVDRRVSTVAMGLAPVVGLALGATLAGAGLGLRALGGSPLLAAAVLVALGVLLTRGLHIDGLADTVDALGSYRDRDAALDIMKKPDVGPFGVAAVVLALLIQVAAVAALLAQPWPLALTSIAAATGCGRLAVTLACRHGIPSARADGLGALVAGSVPYWVLVVSAAPVAWVATAPLSGSDPGNRNLAMAAALAASWLLVRQAVRRFGGITGDVLGACVEVTTTVAYVVLALGS